VAYQKYGYIKVHIHLPSCRKLLNSGLWTNTCQHGLSVYNTAKCLNYIILKTNFCFEKYRTSLPADLSRAFCSFRCLNHRLPIEAGRFTGVGRVGNVCNCNQLGDEFHYLFNYTFFRNERKDLLPRHLLKRKLILSHLIWLAFLFLVCKEGWNVEW
jgi:hypothetical protein